MAKEKHKGLGIFVKICTAVFFTLLDAAMVFALTMALLAWLFDPFLIETDKLRLLIPFDQTILAVAAVSVLIRILARKLVNRHLYHTPGPLDLPPIKGLAYTVLGLIGLIVAFEGILIACDIEESLPSYTVDGETGYTFKTGGFIEPDPFYLWKFSAGLDYHHGVINELGFIGDVPAESKAIGEKRVVCLGGTTTCFPNPSYPAILEEKLNDSSKGQDRWEVFDLSVERYSVVQSREVFRHTAKRYQPDYVVLYFGWDDHWRSGKPDSKRMAVRKTSEMQTWMTRMGKKRFVQMIDNSANSERNQGRKDNPDNVRVPIEEFRWTLTSLIEEIQETDAEAVVIIPARGSLHNELVKKGLVEDLQKATKLHSEYNRVIREVVDETKATIVDFQEYAKEELPTRLVLDGKPSDSPIFETNGMLLNETGRMYLADQLILKIH